MNTSTLLLFLKIIHLNSCLLFRISQIKSQNEENFSWIFFTSSEIKKILEFHQGSWSLWIFRLVFIRGLLLETSQIRAASQFSLKLGELKISYSNAFSQLNSPMLHAWWPFHLSIFGRTVHCLFTRIKKFFWRPRLFLDQNGTTSSIWHHSINLISRGQGCFSLKSGLSSRPQSPSESCKLHLQHLWPGNQPPVGSKTDPFHHSKPPGLITS